MAKNKRRKRKGRKKRKADRRAQQKKEPPKPAQPEPKQSKWYKLPLIGTAIAVGASAIIGLASWYSSSRDKQVYHPIPVAGTEAPVSGSSLEKITYEAACKDESLRQAYLDQLLERVGNENKYFKAIKGLVYKSDLDDTGDSAYHRDGAVVVARYDRWATKKGERGDVELSKHAFNPGMIRSEQQLLSVLDNESVHAALVRYGSGAFPTFDVDTKEELNAVSPFLKTFSDTPLFGILHEYHSTMHQLLMIKNRTRKVDRKFVATIGRVYDTVRKQLAKDAKGTPYEIAVRIILDHTRMKDIGEGKVRIR